MSLFVMMSRVVLFVLILMSSPLVFGKGLYQKPADFINEVFSGDVPRPTALWITKELKSGVKAIMGHKLASLRVRYWGRDQRTAWVLEEVGKEKPITIGVVVNQGKVERLKVLVFRESRGYEVRYPFFTDQFHGRQLNAEHYLDQTIDGISGATLSVRALTKVARLALYLHQHSKFTHVEP